MEISYCTECGYRTRPDTTLVLVANKRMVRNLSHVSILSRLYCCVHVTANQRIRNTDVDYRANLNSGMGGRYIYH